MSILFVSILYLIIGFVVLVYGADFLVDGSSSLAKRLNIPVMIIGLTVVAFGTSAPELVVNIIAAVDGKGQLPLANVIGSNIFNILGALGLTALICPFLVKKVSRRIDVPIAIFAAILLFSFAYLNMKLTRLEGVILLLCFIIFMAYTVVLTIRNKNTGGEDEIEIHDYTLGKSILLTLAGLLGLVLGGKLLVEGAVEIALELGVTERIVGLTVVSIGTSLPELMTSLVAARKGNSDIAIGNVIGSNIINTFLVLGASTVICPVNVSSANLMDLILNLVAVLLVIVFIYMSKARRMSRVKGAVLLSVYIGYMVYLVFQNI